jgi:hypothetical protein
VEGESWAGRERRDQIKERESREQQRQNDETQKKDARSQNGDFGLNSQQRECRSTRQSLAHRSVIDT